MHLRRRQCLLCRPTAPLEDAPYRISNYPYTNKADLVTCSLCLVAIDTLVEKGLMVVRMDKLVIFAEDLEDPAYICVERFVQARAADEETTFNRDDLALLSENTGLPKPEISKRLKDSGLRIVGPSVEEKPEYTFKSGGTFGFHGLG